jgi:hypothetical protein
MTRRAVLSGGLGLVALGVLGGAGCVPATAQSRSVASYVYQADAARELDAVWFVSEDRLWGCASKVEGPVCRVVYDGPIAGLASHVMRVGDDRQTDAVWLTAESGKVVLRCSAAEGLPQCVPVR